MDLNAPLMQLATLGFFVFLAGLVDSMAGGGGLITLPAYLQFGLPLNRLLGTNKLSSSLGTTVAVFKYLAELRFEKDFLFVLVVFAALGSFLGARFISLLPPQFIRYLLIIALPPVAFFIITRHRFGLSDQSGLTAEKTLLFRAVLIAFFISFYDGLLGPGTGTFLAVALVRFCGYDLLKATALSKLLNLTSNISALLAFLLLGLVDIKLGLAMGAVGMAGNYVGSHLALKKGVWLIRPTLFIVSNALLAKIIWDMLK
ncbi:MAG: TSUP family transporter [Elusimicrobia bacterium]|nr:TSUP family transporter [Elusimicrobiota bacterium]